MSSSARKPRVTARQPTPKLGVMRDIIPLSAVELGVMRTDRDFKIREHVGKSGFVEYVTSDRDLTSHKAEAPKSVSATLEDLRGPIRQVDGVWLRADGAVIRTVSMEDDSLPKRPKAQADTPKARKAGQPRTRKGSVDPGAPRPERESGPKTTRDEVKLYATQWAIKKGVLHKINLDDPRVLARVRDLMAHESQVAAYSRKR